MFTECIYYHRDVKAFSIDLRTYRDYGAWFDMMIVPEAANMPPTPWQPLTPVRLFRRQDVIKPWRGAFDPLQMRVARAVMVVDPHTRK